MLGYRLFVVCCCCILLTQAVRKNGGARKRTINNTVSSNSVADIPPERRTYMEWSSLEDEALRLACHNEHLVETGSHEDLVNRLFAFYHAAPAVVAQPPQPAPVVSRPVLVPPVSSISSPVDISSMVAAEVRRILGQQSDSNRHNGHENIVNINSNGPDVASAGNDMGVNNCLDSLPSGSAGLSSATCSQSVGLLGSSSASIEPQAGGDFPAVPKAVIEKIKKHEFVEFDTLLPNYSPLLRDELGFQWVDGSEPGMRLVPKTQTRPRVSDFTSWMVAWNNFMAIYVHFWPHRIMELLRYQAIICDFASQFTVSSWMGYERMFRLRVSQNHGLSWDRIDDSLYNRYLRHSTLQVLCFSCRNFGHTSRSCPLQGSAQSTSSNVRTGAATSSPQPFRAPQQRPSFDSTGGQVPSSSRADAGRVPPPGRRGTCFYFNGDGCNSADCRYEHVCFVCFGRHPASRCSRRFSK